MNSQKVRGSFHLFRVDALTATAAEIMGFLIGFNRVLTSDRPDRTPAVTWTSSQVEPPPPPPPSPPSPLPPPLRYPARAERAGQRPSAGQPANLPAPPQLSLTWNEPRPLIGQNFRNGQSQGATHARLAQPEQASSALASETKWRVMFWVSENRKVENFGRRENWVKGLGGQRGERGASEEPGAGDVLNRGEPIIFRESRQISCSLFKTGI